MDNSVRHEGIIDSMEGEHVRVRIVQTSACAGCKIAGHCNASDAKVKVVDVYGCQQSGLKVGDSVVVSTSLSSARKALMLGFGLPLVLLLAVLGLMLGLHADQGVAALTAIAVLIPYNIIVWLCRRRIAQTVSFIIE